LGCARSGWVIPWNASHRTHVDHDARLTVTITLLLGGWVILSEPDAL